MFGMYWDTHDEALFAIPSRTLAYLYRQVAIVMNNPHASLLTAESPWWEMIHEDIATVAARQGKSSPM